MVYFYGRTNEQSLPTLELTAGEHQRLSKLGIDAAKQALRESGFNLGNQDISESDVALASLTSLETVKTADGDLLDGGSEVFQGFRDALEYRKAFVKLAEIEAGYPLHLLKSNIEAQEQGVAR